jgi:hypothetical protein
MLFQAVINFVSRLNCLDQNLVYNANGPLKGSDLTSTTATVNQSDAFVLSV